MIIGLTGSIASGKSTVSKMLKEYGYPIVDADKIAREVVQPETEVISKIRNVFGSQVIHEDGTLNRDALGAVIFGNEEKRKQLNAIIHPAIRAEMLRQKDLHLENGAKTVVMDIPLLFESKLQHYVEKIMVVSVTRDIQLQRLMQRDGFSEEEACQRMDAQLPMTIKEEGADAIIYNNGTIEETRQQLDEVLRSWDV